MSSILPSAPKPTPTRRLWKLFVGLGVCVHLLAVFAEPFRFFTQSSVKPAAEEAGWLRDTLAPYVEFMYLSHGYAFFAPNPGPSHLLECEIKAVLPSHTPPESTSLVDTERKETASTKNAVDSNPEQHAWLSKSGRDRLGRPPIDSNSRWRVFPDRFVDRPRLLYHRYFMLSEFYQNLFAPVKLSEAELQEPGLRERWEQDRRLYETLQATIRKRLSDNPSEETGVELTRIEHALPSRLQILGERWKLTDPRLYVELSEGDEQP